MTRLKMMLILTMTFSQWAFAIDWKQKLILKSDAIKSVDASTRKEFQKKDFSGILYSSKYFGFIDPNYQKLSLEFRKVTKTGKLNEQKYLVKGASKVGLSQCEFTGTLKITKIEFSKNEYPSEQEVVESGQSSGTYLLTEENKVGKDSSCKGAGVFEGVIYFNWIYGREEGDANPDFYNYGTTFNQMFVGTWKSFSGKSKKTANWGDGRVPDSGDLDIGSEADGFTPNPKYLKQGWKD